jgi:hypothetical protein
VKVGEVGVDGAAREAGERRAGEGGAAKGATGFEGRSEDGGEAVAKVRVVLESGGPKGGVDSFGPAVSGVKQSSAGLGRYIFDAILGAPILVVGVDAAERKGLIGGSDGGAKSGSVKEAVVGVIVSDGDTMFRAEALKGLLGSNSGVLVEFGHEVDVREVGKVIDEDGGASVASGGRGAAVSRDEAGGGTDELVNTDDLAGKGGRFDGTQIADALGPPGFAVGFAVSTSGTEGGGDVGQFVWNHVCPRQQL